MDKQGVDIQALSINGFWWYEVKDQGLARAICTAQNEGLAAWVKRHPDRFVANGLGAAAVSRHWPRKSCRTR